MTERKTDTASKSAEFKNELEYILAGARDGIVNIKTFYEVLLKSPVYLLCNKPWDGKTQDSELQALIMKLQDGSELIAMFTDESRVRAARNQFKEYSYPTLVAAFGVLQGLSANTGVSVNPGAELGVQIKPDGVRQLKELIQASAITRTPAAGGHEEAQ